MNKNILYVSDLDGTLLSSNQTTSAYTSQVINRMTEQGILFSHNVYPTVYSMLDGKERFSNIPEKSSEGTLEFIASRNDSRERMVSTENELADEAYAVENAASELKVAATAVIGGNNQDGVAKWLEQNCLE